MEIEELEKIKHIKFKVLEEFSILGIIYLKGTLLTIKDMLFIMNILKSNHSNYEEEIFKRVEAVKMNE